MNYMYIDDFNYMQTLVGSLMSLLYFLNNYFIHCRGGGVIKYKTFCPGHFVISYHHIEVIIARKPLLRDEDSRPGHIIVFTISLCNLLRS